MTMSFREGVLDSMESGGVVVFAVSRRHAVAPASWPLFEVQRRRGRGPPLPVSKNG